jgi:transcription elongation regulator 1
MHPWETSLPLLKSDDRFASLETSLQPPSQRDIFEEYCKEVLKERRTAKGLSAEDAGVGTGAGHDGYRKLLKETVISTRTTYTEFRQKVKKERRFYSYGRDEKEREREFR